MRQAFCRAQLNNLQFNFLFPITGSLAVACLLLICGTDIVISQTSLTAQELETTGTKFLLSLDDRSALEQEIAGPERHVFSMQVPAGQFVRITVDQRGAVLNAKLKAPNGVPLLDGVTPNALSEVAVVSFISHEAGEYRLEIANVRKETPARKYAIKVEERRAAKTDDQDRTVGDRLIMEAGSLIAATNANNLKAATEKYRSALDLWRKIGAQSETAQTLLSLGAISHNLSQRAAAMDYYQQALPIWRAIKDRRKEAQTLSAMGWSYFGSGDFKNARENYNQALPIRRELGDLRGQAQTLTTLGQVQSALGEPRQAIENFTEGLRLARQVGDKVQQAFALNNFGYMYGTLGEYQKGLDCLAEAVILWRETGNRYGEADSLNSTGIIYDHLGDFERSVDHYNQALKIWTHLGYRGGEADALNNIGVAMLNRVLVHGNEGNLDVSLDYLNRALKIRRAIGQGLGEESTLLALGVANQYLKQTDRASGFFNEVLAKHPKHPLALHNIGFNYFLSKDFPKAIDYFKQALIGERERGRKHAEAMTLRLLAASQMQIGQLIEARDNAQKAVEIAESSRSPILDPEMRMLHRGVTSSYLVVLIDALSRLHKLDPTAGYDLKAFEASEQGRARGLLEMLSQARIDLSRDVEPKALERTHSLELQLNAKEQYKARLIGVKGQEAELLTVENEIRLLETQYQLARSSLLRAHPKYAALTQPKTTTVRDTQALLDNETLLLEYQLGERKSYLWAISSKSVVMEVLPAGDTIKTQARLVYDLLTARNTHPAGETAPQKAARVARADAEFATAAASLSDILLGPISSILGQKRLVIVSDSLLQYVPFGALPTPVGTVRPGRLAGARLPLIVDHEIVNLPSASVLEVLRREFGKRPSPAKTLAVIADPVYSKNDPRVRPAATDATPMLTSRNPASDLPGGTATTETQTSRYGRLRFSRDEAQNIAAFAPRASSFAALDFNASKKTVLNSELGQYRILHFATHGSLDTQRPELSGLVLSVVGESGEDLDGYLRLNEIYKLKLNADLAVLSGCETALGKDLKGEGLVGLTRGFMYAGVPRVISSLWSVDDRATSELMKRFYRGVLVKRLTPAAALRSAQKSMLLDRGWSSPYYWAPFTLQGEWK